MKSLRWIDVRNWEVKFFEKQEISADCTENMNGGGVKNDIDNSCSNNEIHG